MRARSASGSVDSPSAVEPTRSQKRTVTTLRCSRMAASLRADGLELGELDVRRERCRECGIEPTRSDLAHRGRARRRPRARIASSGERSSPIAARNCARSTSPEPTPDTGSTCGANARIRRVFRPKRRSAKHPFSSVMRTLRGTHLRDRVERHEEVVVVLELLPDELLGLALVRRDEERPRLDARAAAARLRCRARRGRRDARDRAPHRRRTSSPPFAEASRRARRSRRRARGSGASP